MKDSSYDNGAAPRCTAKTCAVFALIFLAAVAASRFLDIRAASLRADALASGSAAEACSIASVLLSLGALAFAGGAVIFSAAYGKEKTAFAAASLFSAVILADRIFYVVYSVSTNVRTFSSGAGAEAYVRVGSDALFACAALFLTAAFSVRTVSKYGAESGRVKTFPPLVFAGILTLGQLIYQTYVTVSFFASYDDVTAVEKSNIAADYFYILLKYGVITYGAVVLLFALLSGLFKRSADKNLKNR